jgi:hypothetical protein
MLKIPLEPKIFGWYLRRGVILTKGNFVKRNWHGSTQCMFCHHDETINHLFFQCRFARSIWSLIQVASSMYPPTTVANIFGNWLHGIDLRFRTLLRVGALVVVWSLWICRNDKFLMIKIVLSCRLSTDVPVFSVCGHLCSGWSIETYLRRSVHGWRIRWEILFPYMGGRII